MKVIELLNMISKGEEVPTPIRFRNDYYDFDDGDYFNQQHRRWIFNDNDISGILNEEIEIVEEDKKIEHKKCYFDFTISSDDVKFSYLYKMETRIMDKINSMEDK